MGSEEAKEMEESYLSIYLSITNVKHKSPLAAADVTGKVESALTVDMLSEGCFNLTKYFLFLFNLLSFFLGVVLFSVGLWTVLDQDSFLRLGPASMSLFPLSYLVMIGGCITVCVAFFGCLGALKEVKCMLGVYFFLLTILLASEIIVVVLCFTQMTSIQTKLDEQVLQTISSYGKNQSSLQKMEKTLNHIQNKVQCCGWYGLDDWPGSRVPCSCFSADNITQLRSNTLNTLNRNQSSTVSCNCHNQLLLPNATVCHVHQTGCKKSITGWMEDNMITLVGMLVAIVLTELSVLILSMCLYKSIVFDYYFLHRLS
ncbi:leukocyte antigen CD37-like isoform X1 [Arapaima gigas]